MRKTQRWTVGVVPTMGIVATLLAAPPLAAQVPTRDVPIRDPVMVREDGTYYLFATGRGIAVWSSPDMKRWTREPAVFETAPEWAQTLIPDFRDDIRAPDIYHHDGTYFLYYSVGSHGRNSSAIGVATNSTLDRGDPRFRWVDHGIVVRSVPGRDMWNAVDPHVMHDHEGVPWMSFGSQWGGHKLVRLAENLTELSRSPREWRTIAARHRFWKLDDRDGGDSANPELEYDGLYPQRILEMNRTSQSGAVEAPFIFRKNGYYHQFASWDRCCGGVESTSRIVVGRAKDIRGPYSDREGQNMNHGGGSAVVRGLHDSLRWAAAGRSSAYTFDGVDYLVFHAYDKLDEGRSKLVILPIQWDEDGWPYVVLED
jgi:arabinan endo-1,5-alpha-L-arabinosidase